MKLLVIKNLENCLTSSFDFAIISNESNLHANTALILAQKKIPFIIEKPLSHEMKNVKQLLLAGTVIPPEASGEKWAIDKKEAHALTPTII